jgi:hypothetical protein
MLKRYLPLLFVVLVVIATVVLFLALRDPEGSADPATLPAAAPGGAGDPAGAQAFGQPGADGVREFRVTSEADYQRALEVLGTSNDDIEAWARSQGFPPATYTPTPGLPLERNYRREPDRQLRQLVAEGDLWAMQFLARRISPEHPEEAIGLYRQAAVLGSAYAAFSLGTLYGEIERWVALVGDDREEVRAIVEREDPIGHSALGWLMVAEHEAGLPPGAISATLARFHAPDEEIDRACARAAGFLSGLRAERATKGIEVPVRKPPLAIELPPEEVVGYCAPEVFPRADFSGCETIRLVSDTGSLTGHRCR